MFVLIFETESFKTNIEKKAGNLNSLIGNLKTSSENQLRHIFKRFYMICMENWSWHMTCNL